MRSGRSTRTTVAIGATGCLLLAAVACGGGTDAGEVPPAVSDGGGVASDGGAVGSSDGGSQDPPTAGAPAPGVGGGADGDVEDCTTAGLDITIAQGDSGAGRIRYTLTFTNTGSDPCRISGHPSVVAVGDDAPIGRAAQQAEGEGEPAVLLPEGSAISELQATDIGSGGGPLGEDCQVAPADGWRISAPGDDAAEDLPQDGLTACGGDVDWLSVTPTHPSS